MALIMRERDPVESRALGVGRMLDRAGTRELGEVGVEGEFHWGIREIRRRRSPEEIKQGIIYFQDRRLDRGSVLSNKDKFGEK